VVGRTYGRTDGRIPTDGRTFPPLMLLGRLRGVDLKAHKFNGVDRVIHPSVSVCVCVCRTANSEAEEEGSRRTSGRREAASDGVHRRSAGPTQARVRREQVLDRGTTPVARRRAATQRVTDQDLVPEQARQDEEGERRAQPAGAAAHGSRTLQPFVGRTALTEAAAATQQTCKITLYAQS